MGADLFIDTLYEENRKKYEPEFHKWVGIRDKATDKLTKEEAQKKVSEYYELMQSEGYFRDAYNGTNVLNRMGLSWWQDIDKLINKKGVMPVRNATKFLAIVQAAKLEVMTTKKLKENNCTVDENETVESWNKFFIEQKQDLITFLQKAIELKVGIRCSI